MSLLGPRDRHAASGNDSPSCPFCGSGADSPAAASLTMLSFGHKLAVHLLLAALCVVWLTPSQTDEAVDARVGHVSVPAQSHVHRAFDFQGAVEAEQEEPEGDKRSVALVAQGTAFARLATARSAPALYSGACFRPADPCAAHLARGPPLA